MISGDIWLPFLTGLLGSGHCIGMCGGFVLALGFRRTDNPVVTQVLYNAGRILTYGTLGAVFGGLGSFSRGAAAMGQWRATVLFFAGAFMIALALNILGLFGKPWEPSAEFTEGRFGGIVRTLMTGGPLSSFPLGLVMGLVPCGLVYTMLISAAAAASAPGGAKTMAAFGLGTLPAMLGLGTLASRLSVSSRLNLYHGAAVLVILMALRFILQGAALLGWLPHTLLW